MLPTMKGKWLLFLLLAGLSVACAQADLTRVDRRALKEGGEGGDIDLRFLRTSELHRVPLDQRHSATLSLESDAIALTLDSGNKITFPTTMAVLEAGAPDVLIRDVNDDRRKDLFVKTMEVASGACYSLSIQKVSDAVRFHQHPDIFCNPQVDYKTGKVTRLNRHGPYADIYSYEKSADGALSLRSQEEVVGYNFSQYKVYAESAGEHSSSVIYRGLPECGSAIAEVSEGARLYQALDSTKTIDVPLGRQRLVQLLKVAPNPQGDMWAEVRPVEAAGPTGWLSLQNLEVDRELVTTHCSGSD